MKITVELSEACVEVLQDIADDAGVGVKVTAAAFLETFAKKMVEQASNDMDQAMLKRDEK